MAVSKTQPLEHIVALYEQGQRLFGENRVQELTTKYEALPKDIEWHLIGHLQTNKVKYIAPFISMIHAVDSWDLIVEIEKQASKSNRMIDCLLQFYIASEETKFGLSYEEAAQIVTQIQAMNFQHVHICGVMGMATNTDDEVQIRNEFRTLHGYFTQMKQDFFSDASHFKEISMGMSGDWEIALSEGSTLLRIGSILFP